MDKETDNVPGIFNIMFIAKLFIGVIICVIFVYVATLPVFIKPKYESEAIVYVPLTLLSQQLNQQGIGFANDKEIDWYIQLLKSNQLADSIIALVNEPIQDINENSKLYSNLEANIKIEKTRYGSVSIKARDENPKTAAAIANKIIELGESIKKELLNPNRIEALNNAKSLYDQKSVQIDSLEKIIYSYERNKDKAIDNFYYNKAIKIYNQELNELIARKNLFEKEKRNFDTPLPKTYIISSAIPSSKPVWPVRWLLCLIGAGLYIFSLLVIEIIKRDFVKTAN